MTQTFERYTTSQEHPCEVCGEWPDDCTCEPCPTCGVQGDPACLRGECGGKTRIVCEGDAVSVTAFADYVGQLDDVAIESQTATGIVVVVAASCTGATLYTAQKYGLETA